MTTLMGLVPFQRGSIGPKTIIGVVQVDRLPFRTLCNKIHCAKTKYTAPAIFVT